MDRHVVTTQRPRPIKQIIKDIETRLQAESDTLERDYLERVLKYYKERRYRNELDTEA